MGEWQNGICGCFNNCGMCIFTYFIPCYTFGKTAEAVGDGCCLCGICLLVPLVNLFAICNVRGKVRENKGIDGGAVGDFFATFCCPFCVVIQIAQEMAVSTPFGAGESIARQ